MIRPLDDSRLRETCEDLASRIAPFRNILSRWGPPPLWRRDPGFLCLVKIILEQQVSLESADKAYSRLLGEMVRPSPSAFLALNDAMLRACGFSRQKARYSRLLAEDIVHGRLDLDALFHMEDSPAIARLTALTGIGPWSARIYLLMALLRPDVWPSGDQALLLAAREHFPRSRLRDFEALDRKALQWKPYRSTAARLLWWDYLQKRGR